MFPNKTLLIGVVISVISVVLMSYFSEIKLISSVLLGCVLLGIFLFLKEQQLITLSIWDYGLFALIGVEISIFIFSVNPLNSYSVLVSNIVAVTCFFLAKILLKNEKNTLLFFRLSVYFILGLCIFSVYSFWILKNTLHYVEWYSIYDFRHLHRPFGLISNVWYSFLLIFLSYILFFYFTFQKNKLLCYITLVFIVLNLLISFSRSIYSILLLIVFINIIQFLLTKQNGKIVVCFLIPIIGFYAVFKNDYNKTLSFNTSISQQRSISARVNSTENAISLLKSNFTGYGQGSYSLVNSERFENVDVPFTSFAPNTLAQFFVEKGIFGTLIWGIFFIFLVFCILQKSYKRKNKTLFFIAFIFFLSFSLREFSFAVFQENTYYQILFYIFIALLLHYSELNTLFQRKIHSKHLLYYFLCLFFTLITSVFFFKDKISIEKQVFSGVTHWNSYQKNHSKTELNQSFNYFEKAQQNNPYDTFLTFFKVMTIYEKGNKEQALKKLHSLFEKYPNNPMYSFALFSILYKENHPKNKDFLIKSIELSPKIIDTDFFKDFLEKNPTIYEEFKAFFFKKYTNYSTENPFELGKQGKILLFFGFEIEAYEKLEKAIKLYPALSYVWLNLYLITEKELFFDRFILLEYGSYFVKNKEKYPTDFFIKKTNIEFLQNPYIPKYRNWYMKNPTCFIIN